LFSIDIILNDYPHNVQRIVEQGLCPYNPTRFFALTQKSKQKKSKLHPLRLKNYRSKG
jgi:hypothetical protein